MTDTITIESPQSQEHKQANAAPNALAIQRNLSDVVAEYDQKIAAIPDSIANFEKAGNTLKTAACVAGTWGETTLETGRVYDNHLKESLLKSAWRHVYNGLSIESIASAKDKQRFQQAMTAPAPFTLDNIRATFGDFLLNPRGNILRGLAEVFSDLDPAYKSHDKVKIGVTGLPKRVIVSGFGSWSGWGQDKTRDVINAIAAYQGKPLVEYHELEALLKNETALLAEWTTKVRDNKDKTFPPRGVRLRRFSNGNGHLFFEPDTLRDINKALAEYYGEVLADCSEEKPEQQRVSTAVSKDLQYYPTPAAVVKKVLQHGQRISNML